MAAARKQSMYPPEGRRKSIWERKPSVDGSRKSITLDTHVGGRRPSMDQGGRRMSIFDLQRKSSVADSLLGRYGHSADKNRNIRYENTYRDKPDELFPAHKAKEIASDVLETFLDGKEYHKEECTRLSKILSDKIKQQVKELNFPRYKIVCIVAIGQEQESHPSLSFTSRCIWNDKLDNFAEATFKSRSLYAVALVYAVFAE